MSVSHRAFPGEVRGERVEHPLLPTLRNSHLGEREGLEAVDVEHCPGLVHPPTDGTGAAPAPARAGRVKIILFKYFFYLPADICGMWGTIGYGSTHGVPTSCAGWPNFVKR